MHQTMTLPGCSGTTIKTLGVGLGLHLLEVRVDPQGEIPLHQHDCAATMIVTGGSAHKLMSDGSLGPKVLPGDVINKAACELHGFSKVGPDGFTFISLSDKDGILKENHSLDMVFAN